MNKIFIFRNIGGIWQETRKLVEMAQILRISRNEVARATLGLYLGIDFQAGSPNTVHLRKTECERLDCSSPQGGRNY